MLLEHQRFSQYMFEEIFGMQFSKAFKLKKRTVAGRYTNSNKDHYIHTSTQGLSNLELSIIDRLNMYDIGEWYFWSQ